MGYGRAAVSSMIVVEVQGPASGWRSASQNQAEASVAKWVPASFV